jgi:hypothetical protein
VNPSLALIGGQPGYRLQCRLCNSFKWGEGGGDVGTGVGLMTDKNLFEPSGALKDSNYTFKRVFPVAL